MKEFSDEWYAEQAALFVDEPTAEATPDAERAHKREHALARVERYLYGGWTYRGWGTLDGRNGFWFVGPKNGGFGAAVLAERMASGLLWAQVRPVEEAGDGGDEYHEGLEAWE